MIHQLKPSILVALQENGVIKHFNCNDVILSTNYTYGMNLRKNNFEDKKEII